MYDWFETLSTFEKIFWYIAIPFSLVFFIQLILSVSGHDGRKTEKENGMHHDDTLQAGTTTNPLTFVSCLLSLRNFILFLLTFGWMGIVANGKGLTHSNTVLFAIGTGIIAWLIFSVLFYLWNKSKQQL